MLARANLGGFRRDSGQRGAAVLMNEPFAHRDADGDAQVLGLSPSEIAATRALAALEDVPRRPHELVGGAAPQTFDAELLHETSIARKSPLRDPISGEERGDACRPAPAVSTG